MLDNPAGGLPAGYTGAPLTAVLARALLRRGHRVSAITLSNDVPPGEAREARSPRHEFSIRFVGMRRRAWRFNGARPGRIVDLYALERRGMVEAIAKVQPDLVHAHWCYEFALAALASGLPHLVTCHDSPVRAARYYSRSAPTRSIYRWLRVLMARQALGAARHVSVVSPYLAGEILPMLRHCRPLVVPNPIDERALALAQARQRGASLAIGMVCNGWSAIKNSRAAFAAFARLRRRWPAAKLQVFGHDHGPSEYAERWCIAHDLDQGVVFRGALPHGEWPGQGSFLDLLLHPSREDTFGVAIAEAMAMGVPVVAGAHSGAVPWVVGEGGALCDIDDPVAIAAAVESVLEPTAYARYSRASLERIRSAFGPDAVAAAYEALYRVSLGLGQ